MGDVWLHGGVEFPGTLIRVGVWSTDIYVDRRVSCIEDKLQTRYFLHQFQTVLKAEATVVEAVFMDWNDSIFLELVYQPPKAHEALFFLLVLQNSSLFVSKDTETHDPYKLCTKKLGPYCSLFHKSLGFFKGSEDGLSPVGYVGAQGTDRYTLR